MAVDRKRFSDFVETKDKLMDAEDGLAGKEYKGDYAYPKGNPDYRNSVKPLPYKAEVGEDDGNGKVWVANDEGDQEPLSSKQTKGMDKATALGKPAKGHTKKVPKRKKMTNEEFIAAGKALTPANLLNLFKETHSSTIHDLSGQEFTPEPNTAIRYLAEAVAMSPRLMDRFVIELKRQGGIQAILEGLMDHKESFTHLVEAFNGEDGKVRSNRFAKCLHDQHVSMIAEDIDKSAEKRFQAPPAGGGGKGPIPASKEGGPSLGDDGENQYGEPPGQGVYGRQRVTKPPGGAGEPPGGAPPPGGGAPPGGPPGGGPPPAMPTGGPNPGGTGMPNPASQMPPMPSRPPKKMRYETAAANFFNAAAKYAPLTNLMQVRESI